MKKSTYHCPVEGCGAISGTAPGITGHMRAAHADVWAGSLTQTLGNLGKPHLRVDVEENGVVTTREHSPRPPSESAIRRRDGGWLPPKKRNLPKKRKYTRQVRDVLQRAANESAPGSDPQLGMINHCPACGAKIRHFLLAAGFIRRLR